LVSRASGIGSIPIVELGGFAQVRHRCLEILRAGH
jgi:hypothetical protein